MATCGHQGRPDMYGLGIRLGIYIQWFSEILVEFFDEADVSDIRLLGLLLPGGIILGLLVAIASQDVHPADVYTVLQLAAGCYIFLIPIYIWNALSCCDPQWDPLKWTGETKMPVYDVSNVILLTVISAVGIWFFATYVPIKGHHCEQYGFFFAKIKLDNAAFMVVNIIIYIAIILVCVAIALSWTGFWDGQFQMRRRRRRRRSHRRQLASLSPFSSAKEMIHSHNLVSDMKPSGESNTSKNASQDGNAQDRNKKIYCGPCEAYRILSSTGFTSRPLS
jgi:hypothetical protein